MRSTERGERPVQREGHEAGRSPDGVWFGQDFKRSWHGGFMRFWWLTILMVFTGPVCAEWVEAGRNDATSVYFDPGTVDRGTPSHIKVWLLFDHAEPHRLYAKTYQSGKEFVELDCGQARYQILKFILYPAPMGMGGALDVSGGRGLWLGLESTDVRTDLFRKLCSL